MLKRKPPAALWLFLSDWPFRFDISELDDDLEVSHLTCGPRMDCVILSFSAFNQDTRGVFSF